jgi:predicted DNA binding CopG/RHH family protein
MKPARQAVKNEKHIPDSAIDFSDIPESSTQELRRARRVGRPRKDDAKQLIAIRIRPSLLIKIQKKAKKEGKPYQTLIHEILEKTLSP